MKTSFRSSIGFNLQRVGDRYRLILPHSHRTNVIVEKCKDTIKNNTVGIKEYETRDQMIKYILELMMFYNLHRRY